jgi:hypothetical protein
MKRFAVLLFALPFAAAACAGPGAVSLGPAPNPAGTSTPTPSASPTLPLEPSHSPSSGPASPSQATPARLYTYQLWFTRGGRLFETKRTEAFTQSIGTLALTRLLGGPSSAERNASVSTDIPSGTRLLGLTIGNGTATVDLSSSFESSTSSATMSLRLAEVVYTTTQFSTVHDVRFSIDGRGRTTVGGVPVQQPQTRAMFESFLPAIVVESPVIGAPVSSPVTVSGTADVFEATVTVRILDANGHEIARAFTQATCGTGCRGTFSVSVTYHVSSAQPGTIEVFDQSAQDGSPENVQEIPVTLTV